MSSKQILEISYWPCQEKKYFYFPDMDNDSIIENIRKLYFWTMTANRMSTWTSHNILTEEGSLLKSSVLFMHAYPARDR